MPTWTNNYAMKYTDIISIAGEDFWKMLTPRADSKDTRTCTEIRWYP